jgi:type I restriction enzyme S subunit
MSGWPTKPLGDIFEIARGGSPRPIDDFITDDPAGINWITISDATEGSKYITSTRRRIRPEGAQRSRQVKPGDFLLTNSMSFGKPYIMRTEGCIHDGWLVLSPRSDDVDADFFYYLLGSKAVYAEFERRASGVTVKNLNIDLVRGVTVHLPPLPEQRRIAAILDKADALRAKRRAALAQLDTLTQSIFLDMFGDPATNPKGWPVVSIADICEVKGGKRLPKGEEYSSIPTPFRYIRVVDLKAGRVDESALVYLKPATQAEIARYVVNAGDVIISIAGSIGLVAPVPRSLDGVNLTENAAKIVPRSSGCYEAECLARYLETDHAQGQIGSHIGQVTIGKLALFRIEKLRVPLPPIEVQREFVCRAAEVEAHRTVQREACSRLDELFASLQHRAFRGEL